MPGYIHKMLHPEIYHGHGKPPPFFEGWYYKLVSKDENSRYAIIPGVILGGKGHAFIQVLNGISGDSSYHVFPLDSFWSSKERFEIRIDRNEFSSNRIKLHIDDHERSVSGELRFEGVKPWPVNWISPGIMGWYAWVPRMECYHGVVSLDHRIQGRLRVDGQNINFNRGRGYIEKDWGESFPKAWVWFQSNHFESKGTCITASVAIIPWLRSAFKGFIIGFLFEGQLYRFATYTGAEIERLEISDTQVHWIVKNKDYRLVMMAEKGRGGLLRGPTRLDMGKRIVETLDARVDVELSNRAGNILFQGSGRYAGLEVQGDLDRLLNL